MNKFLISILVPTIEMEFNVYVPNNKKIGTIKKTILNSIIELSGYNFQKEENEVQFIDRDTGKEYENNMYIKDTGIKNGTKIIVI
jgi:hypothetical protein